MRRHKKNSHKKASPPAQKPTYTYTFPQDETKAKIDTAAHGMTKALEDFKTHPAITKEDIEQDIRIACKTLRAVPHFTNDHALYTRIATHWYTYGYLTMQAIYQKDREGYKTERRKFEEHGWDFCYQFMHEKIVESMMVAGVQKWQG